jgi:hypothetical protein
LGDEQSQEVQDVFEREMRQASQKSSVNDARKNKHVGSYVLIRNPIQLVLHRYVYVCDGLHEFDFVLLSILGCLKFKQQRLLSATEQFIMFDIVVDHLLHLFIFPPSDLQVPFPQCTRIPFPGCQSRCPFCIQ